MGGVGGGGGIKRLVLFYRCTMTRSLKNEFPFSTSLSGADPENFFQGGGPLRKEI